MVSFLKPKEWMYTRTEIMREWVEGKWKGPADDKDLFITIDLMTHVNTLNWAMAAFCYRCKDKAESVGHLHRMLERIDQIIEIIPTSNFLNKVARSIRIELKGYLEFYRIKYQIPYILYGK